MFLKSPNLHIFQQEKPTPKAKAASKKKLSSDEAAAASPPTPKRSKRQSASSAVEQNDASSLSDIDNSYPSIPVRRAGAATHLLNRPVVISRPDLPELDMNSISKTLKSKNISPSGLKFGFLGLGIMGCGIVKNLINSGHKIVVWNRTFSKVISDKFERFTGLSNRFFSVSQIR
jgi:3-hydroxyisobutyrate dehydrogenase